MVPKAKSQGRVGSDDRHQNWGLEVGRPKQILKSETGLRVISVSDRAHTEQHHTPMLVTFSWGYLSLKDGHILMGTIK